MAKEGERSPWVYVGVGCGIIVILLAVALAAVLVLGYRFASDMKEQLTDPGARADRATEILGAESLPEGYNAMMTFSIPWVLDLVMLSDADPDAEGKIESFDSTGFIYVKSIQKGSDRQRMQDYFDGKIDFDDLFRDSGMNIQHQGSFGIEREEEIGRGTLQRDDVRIAYVSNTGRIRVDRGWEAGLSTLMLMECTSDEKMRLGIWFAEEPDGGGEAGPPDYVGTVADPAEISDFMGHFRPCD